ncbi:acetolactate decarboxylase [Bartonella sp. HY038]|uniref:acetolactate decarboxylase n=1 Tax=Bartonella sp. HY038 TaxID=2759660 RepID=UPI0015FD936B|nr:acetolactate decarboxylase [Bartonella sp. HY038]
MTKAISQFSTVNALMSGLYDGVFSAETILKSGDFGLGCSHAFGGEVIIIDGKMIEARGDGIVRTMSSAEKLPFAQVTSFNAEKNISIKNVAKEQLHDVLSSYTKFDNIFLAVKYKGSFDRIKIRRPLEQKKPYKSVLEVVSDQVVDELKNVSGTLIGFFSPSYFSTISVSQFHVHFISDDGTKAGHVMDFAMAEGNLEFERKLGLDIKLPDDPEFLNQNLDIDDMVELIKHVEN